MYSDNLLEDSKVDISKFDPQTLIRAIRQALAAGAHTQAQQLATRASALHPDNAELAKMARILARPVVTRRKGEHNGSARANQLWLKQNYEEYKDKWVALHDGRLLKAANSLQELETAVTDFTDVMVTRV